jgi:gliding motility-associated lipoprotein GldK
MRNIVLVFGLLAAVLSGCSGGKTGRNGELTGVTKRPKWDNPVPFGMLEVPAGSFHMGQNNQDVNYSQIAQNRQITISAFYIDETEISNNEYRQFVNDVLKGGSVEAVDSPIKFLQAYYGYPKPGQPLDPQQYTKMIYPDTLVWLRDFSYSYNEPLVENYWWHPAFDNYPVVGVNWYAAQAFSHYRGLIYNANREKNKKPKLPRFRLPTEAEWEYAARGGFEHKIYPWEGPYIRNSRGCFLANFKPGRGDYIADNFEYTAPVKSYWPNDFGLYCMPGNVAEWVEDDFEESGYTYAHDLNPVYRNPRRYRQPKVIRGGSWKDVAYFLSVGTRTYEFADTTKSFIGVRSVVSELGRSGAANQ